MDEPAPSPTKIEVTVLSAPHGGLNLSEELRMVKAALLYADHVTLVSPNSAMIAILGGVASLPAPAMRAVLEGVARQFTEAGAVDDVERLKRKKRKTVEELLLLKHYQEVLDRAAVDMAIRSSDIVVDAGGNELAYAVAEGLVEVDTLGMEDGLESDDMVGRFVALLIESVGPNAGTLPMIDDTSGDLLRAAEREAGLPERPGREPEEAGLAAYMIETMDAFPDASMAEIIDARRALDSPLVRFRSAMAAMAQTLEAAPWREGFKAEARSLYRRDVAPLLQELREASEQTGVRRALMHHLASGSGRAGTIGGLALTVAAAGTLPELAVPAAALTGLLGLADFTSAVYRQRRDLEAKRGENKMLFLFEANRRLASS